MKTVAQIEKELIGNRQAQAGCGANVQRFSETARGAADSAAGFARWSGKAATEERRLAVFKEREAALLAELPEAKRRDEVAAHERAVAAYDADARELAVEFRREFAKSASKLASLAQRMDESDRIAKVLREASRRLRSSSVPGPDAERLARPVEVTTVTELYGLKGDVDPGRPLTAADMAHKRKVERRRVPAPFRDLLYIPSLDGREPLYKGCALVRRSLT